MSELGKIEVCVIVSCESWDCEKKVIVVPGDGFRPGKPMAEVAWDTQIFVEIYF